MKSPIAILYLDEDADNGVSLDYFEPFRKRPLPEQCVALAVSASVLADELCDVQQSCFDALASGAEAVRQELGVAA